MNENFVTPFVRIMPKRGHEAWMEKITRISLLYNRAEYETVKAGVRDAAIIHVDPKDLDVYVGRFNADGLVYTPILKSGYYEGFSHFHKPVNPGDPYYWYGCVTRTVKDGQVFRDAERAGDHRTIGRLLGFPKCCTTYFSEWFGKNYDPIWVNTDGPTDGYPECNALLRYFGPRIVSHFSCSPTCKKTHTVGSAWFAVMKTMDAETADDLYRLVSGPVIWNSYHGVVQVDTPHFVGLTHTFPIMERPRIIRWTGRRH